MPLAMSKYPCESWTWYNRVNKEVHAFHCNSGRCVRPECRQTWLRLRIAHISSIVKNYSLDKFFTLTIGRNMPVWKAWDDISYLWSKMRHRLKREADKAGIPFRFIAVLESHKDGYPHVHGFTNLYLDVSAWSLHWQECGGGKVVWVEAVQNTVQVGEYVNKQLEVAKYVGKENIVNAISMLPKGRRTIWRSQRLYDELELAKKDLTPECERDTMVVWVLLRRNKHA